MQHARKNLEGKKGETGDKKHGFEVSEMVCP